MTFGKEIKIEEYNYNLPEEKIAKHPLQERDKSKLLLYNSGKINESLFSELPNHFEDSKLIVYNNTKVIQARIHFFKETGAKIEIFCLEPHLPVDFEQNFQQTSSCQWKCIIGNLKKWKKGILQGSFNHKGQSYAIHAERTESFDNYHIIKFDWDGQISFSEVLETTGKTPIPPYLAREAEENDKQRYQTVYSNHKGSVAAPTAGLHFTQEILEKLQQNGHQIGELTLHVGAGTFKPVQSEKIGGHEMHTEHFFASKHLIKSLIESKNKVLAVGTTSVRTLESLYWLGVKILNSGNESTVEHFISQWEPYQDNTDISTEKALSTLLDYMSKNEIESLEGATQIIIVPGYEFRIVKEMITNFHMPKSTLLLLISAFIGKNWNQVYDYALNNDFRFLSYGDSSYLIP